MKFFLKLSSKSIIVLVKAEYFDLIEKLFNNILLTLSCFKFSIKLGFRFRIRIRQTNMDLSGSEPSTLSYSI